MRSIRTVTFAVLAVGGALVPPPPVAGQSGPASIDERARAANSLLSLALPGAGQLRKGQARGWAYVAAEAVAWGIWVERRHRGAELRDRYRDLAWERGRIQGTTRVDASFGYYETLTKWTRSGAFDTDDARDGVQPETDPATFNGSIWSLARGLFLAGSASAGEGTPGWDRAVSYYRERAYDDRFLWDWSQAPGAQQEFADVIDASDERFRQATNVLGVVLANHLISGADAFLSGRAGEAVASLRLHPVETEGGRWLLTGRVGGLP